MRKITYSPHIYPNPFQIPLHHTYQAMCSALYPLLIGLITRLPCIQVVCRRCNLFRPRTSDHACRLSGSREGLQPFLKMSNLNLERCLKPKSTVGRPGISRPSLKRPWWNTLLRVWTGTLIQGTNTSFFFPFSFLLFYFLLTKIFYSHTGLCCASFGNAALHLALSAIALLLQTLGLCCKKVLKPV